jgi:hypothetical protein
MQVHNHIPAVTGHDGNRFAKAKRSQSGSVKMLLPVLECARATTPMRNTNQRQTIHDLMVGIKP